jgi:hypothetical protein
MLAAALLRAERKPQCYPVRIPWWVSPSYQALQAMPLAWRRLFPLR